MELAAQYPDQLDKVVAALKAHVDRTSSVDRDFLAALLLLLDEQTGPDGAARLGDLGDLRAVPPLTHAGETRSAVVAAAAAHALARYPEGLDPLARWLTDEGLAIEVRMAAAEALGELGRIEGGDAIVTALRRRGLPADLRRSMIGVIERDFPQLADSLDNQVTRDGTPWLVAGGAVGLGHALGMTGHFGRSDFGTGLGVAAGAVGGGTLGWVAGRTWPIEAADASFLTSNIVAGQVGGVLIGTSIVQPGAPGTDRVANAGWVGGFAGEAVGFGAGMALRKLHKGSEIDTLEAAMVAGSTSLLAFSIAQQVDFNAIDPNPSAVRLSAGIALLGGQALGHTISPHIALERADGWMMALATTYAGGAALLWPGERAAGLPLLTGVSTGLLSSFAAARFLDPDNQTVFGGAAGMTYGGVIGLGVGMLLDPTLQHDYNAWRGATLGFATAGLALGTYSGWRASEEIARPDVISTALVTGWATWNSAVLYRVTLPRVQQDGWFVLVPAAAGLAMAASTPIVEVPLAYSFSAASLGMWGGFLGASSAQLARKDVGMPMLIASDVGFVAGIVLAAPPLSMPPLVIGMADAGGILTGAVFALGATFATRDRDPILGAALAGSGVGFVGGALLGSRLHRSGRARDTARLRPMKVPGQWAVAPQMMPTDNRNMAIGLSVQGHGW